MLNSATLPVPNGTSAARATAAVAPAVAVRHVRKTFARKGTEPLVAVEDISLAVGQGEVLAILGASGCGKSTLLNLIAGLQHADSGEILIEGRPVAEFEDWRSVGYLFQDDRLLPWRTALDNAAFGLEAGSVPRAERRERAREALKAVNLGEFERAYPHELSGGMRSRVALARSLVCNPRVLLLDEPFSKLDPATRSQMHEELLRLQRERQISVIFVTHDVEEAVVLADRIVVLAPRPGRVRTTEEVDLPRPRSSQDLAVAERIRALRALV